MYPCFNDQQLLLAAFRAALPNIKRAQARNDVDARRQLFFHEGLSQALGNVADGAGGQDEGKFAHKDGYKIAEPEASDQDCFCILGGASLHNPGLQVMRLLLLLFLAIPIIELYVLIKVGSAIGAFTTIMLLFAAAVVGLGLLRWQGLATLNKMRITLARGEVPAMELAEGAIVVLSGLLLLTPGFVTDVLAFACLTPALRRRVILAVLRRAVSLQPAAPRPGRRPWEDRATLEGDYRREE